MNLFVQLKVRLEETFFENDGSIFYDKTEKIDKTITWCFKIESFILKSYRTHQK